MAREAVGGGAEGGVPRRAAVERPVDVRLEMLDAHAHREGLALHGHTAPAQQLEDVARGVTAGEDHAARLDALLVLDAGVIGPHERDGAHAPAGDVEVAHAAAGADLAPRLLDLTDDVGDHAGKHVASDVGLGVPEDLGLGAGGHEGLEDEAVRGALGPGLELPVGERARAAHAELDVALGVELAGLVVAPHRLGAPRGVVAALHEQGLESGARERERAEEPRAPRAHDDGALRRPPDGRGEVVASLVHRPDALVAPRARPRGELGAQRERELHVAAPARVDRAAPALHEREVPLAHAEPPRERAPACCQLPLVRAVQRLEGDPYARNLDHCPSFVADRTQTRIRFGFIVLPPRPPRARSSRPRRG